MKNLIKIKPMKEIYRGNTEVMMVVTQISPFEQKDRGKRKIKKERERKTARCASSWNFLFNLDVINTKTNPLK